jgi:hypothetical protein
VFNYGAHRSNSGLIWRNSTQINPTRKRGYRYTVTEPVPSVGERG